MNYNPADYAPIYLGPALRELWGHIFENKDQLLDALCMDSIACDYSRQFHALLSRPYLDDECLAIMKKKAELCRRIAIHMCNAVKMEELRRREQK